MNKFNAPVGSIVELVGHDTPHCGVVVDDNRSIELIAYRDEEKKGMICKLILIDLRIKQLHPVTNKIPKYTLKQLSNYPWTTEQIKNRIKSLKAKYDGKEYHVIYNNCQHFAWELSTGVAQSPDADKFRLAGDLIGWIYRVKDNVGGSAASSSSQASIKNCQQQLANFLLI